MDANLGYLVGLLSDEFGSRPDVRIRASGKSGVVRSPDLPQDYDEESNTLHHESGVRVQTRLKEYYFPLRWVEQKQFSEIHALIEKIREAES
jgi:hypothetical protein